MNIETEHKQICTMNNGVKIAVNNGKEIIMLLISDVLFFKADNIYAHVFLKDQKSFLITESLVNIETKVSDAAFFRVHRSYLINIQEIDKVWLHENKLLLKNHGQQIPISRYRKQDLKKLIL
jgi:DNA-binding LytR/AlgR family response regulator